MQEIQIDELQIGNVLLWSTASENALSYFTIEASRDGVDWMEIGKVRAAGQSQEEKIYRFLDTEIGLKTTYYRLGMVGTDGLVQYTHTIINNRQRPNSFRVVSMSSVITDGVFRCKVQSATIGRMKITVTTAQDIVIREQELELQMGDQFIPIQLSGEANGIYQMHLELLGEQETLTLQKVQPTDVPMISYVMRN